MKLEFDSYDFKKPVYNSWVRTLSADEATKIANKRLQEMLEDAVTVYSCSTD